MSFPTKESMILRGHEGYVLVARFNADGQYCISGGYDKTVRLWNPHRGNLIKSYGGHGYEIRDIVIASDNAKFASCGGDKLVFYWDVASGRTIRKFQGHFNRVNCVAMNEPGTLLLSGSYDATIHAWDLKSQTFKPIQTLTECTDSVTSVQVVGDAIVVGCVDGHVRTYDVRMGQVMDDHIGPPVTRARLSNDKNCMVAACLDSCVRLLDRANGDLLNEFRGHVNRDYIIDCCTTLDDSYVLCGSEDQLIYVWDLVDATVSQTLKGHTDAVCALDYHPNEPILLSASLDSTVRLWTVPELP